jgi:hypothetical protein
MVTAESSAFVGSRLTGAASSSDTPRDDLCILTVSGIDVDYRTGCLGRVSKTDPEMEGCARFGVLMGEFLTAVKTLRQHFR